MPRSALEVWRTLSQTLQKCLTMWSVRTLAASRVSIEIQWHRCCINDCSTFDYFIHTLWTCPVILLWLCGGTHRLSSSIAVSLNCVFLDIMWITPNGRSIAGSSSDSVYVHLEVGVCCIPCVCERGCVCACVRSLITYIIEYACIWMTNE
jgi:hypothetical protein